MKSQSIITLLTDFGTKDTYVPQMKGVLLSMNPQLKIVDVSHQVSPHNILEGGFLLKTVYSYFPKKTIHVCVVDPGVGTSRKAILIETENYFFIGPDNGIFTFALENEKIKSIIELKNSEYHLKNVSITFHGRDIFTPVAAHLSLGMKPQQFGPALEKIKSLDAPSVHQNEKSVEGEVLYADHFGNLVSNIQKKDLKPHAHYSMKIQDKTIEDISKTYFDRPKNNLVALFGSSGYLEIAIVEGSAKQLFPSFNKIVLQEIKKS
ncbi:MAG: SAM-dependent chlorinase/fluorinase [Deltaproteobacteria bacterium]|nr:SAM-dependent chlorinase/fluorinase [Deltaproteobacteria bacterium]